MLISTKGRYALRVMLDLAENMSGNYIPLRDIAERQEISEKYLESIIKVLVRAGLVDGVRGKGGGYKLTKAPEDYNVGDILRLTEGELAPVACLMSDAQECHRSPDCRTKPMWEKLYKLINDFFDGYTLRDLMGSSSAGNDWVI